MWAFLLRQAVGEGSSIFKGTIFYVYILSSDTFTKPLANFVNCYQLPTVIENSKLKTKK